VAVIRAAMERLGMQTNCPPLESGDRRGNRDLATELVGSPCLAAADAFQLEGVQLIHRHSRSQDGAGSRQTGALETLNY